MVFFKIYKLGLITSSICLKEEKNQNSIFQFNFELEDNAKSCLPLLRIMYFGSVGAHTLCSHGFAVRCVKSLVTRKWVWGSIFGCLFAITSYLLCAKDFFLFLKLCIHRILKKYVAYECKNSMKYHQLSGKFTLTAIYAY